MLGYANDNRMAAFTPDRCVGDPDSNTSIGCYPPEQIVNRDSNSLMSVKPFPGEARLPSKATLMVQL